MYYYSFIYLEVNMISQDGINLIKHFEGKSNKVYPDTNGFATVGYGHLVRPKDNLKIGDEISDELIDKFLLEDLKEAEKKVDKYALIELQQYERDSLISQAFNLTVRSFTKLCGYLVQSKKLYTSKLLLYHKDSSGNVLEGLKRRREAERLLFLGTSWDKIKMDLK